MQVDEALVRENADWRIRQTGIGAELVRQRELQRLQPYLDSFLAHGKIAGIVALRASFELADVGE